MNQFRRSRLIMPLGLLLVVASQCPGQSLFDRRPPGRLNTIANIVARSKGDLLVVMINENSDVENIDERSLDRRGSSSLNSALNYGLTGNIGNQAGAANLGQSSDSARAFSGDSEFRSERQFLDRFAVTVIDVLPNGNLLIEGRRKIVLQGDTRTLQLSGIVRNIDILPNNVVSSQLIANLDIRLLADGAEGEFGRQGWLGRRLNWHLPF